MGITGKIRKFISRHGMIESGDLVIVACSGGPDSVCLLDVLMSLRKELGFSIVAAHFDHGIRGETARRDARFVKSLAEKHGLPFVTGAGDAPMMARERKLSLEDAARRSRYIFLDSITEHFAETHGGGVKVALGHNADDQAETVLMRLLRGSGPRGLAGIPPVRGVYIRPLLEISRAEIMAHLKARKLKWVVDETNESPDYLRNHLRNELMPLLARDYNPNLIATLGRTATALRHASRFLDEEAEKLLKKCRLTSDSALIPREMLAGRHPALALALLEAAIERVRGTLCSLRSEHRLAILDAAKNKGSSSITLPGGLAASIGPRSVRIGPSGKKPRAFSVELNIPGITEIEETGASIASELLEGAPADFKESGPLTAYFDYSKIKKPLIARSFRPGDRMRPLGMKGIRKLQDIFVDMKVPRELRGQLPVIESRGEIIWAASVRTSHDGRITPKTRKVLKLTLFPSFSRARCA